MARKKKKDLPLLEKVKISGIAAEGKALAKVNDKVLFVPFAAPGDVVDVKVSRSRRNYMEGSIQRVHEYAPDRATPFCNHFGVCGGCKWQHMPYEKQLVFKQSQVSDSLERIGKVNLDEVEVLPLAGAEKTTFYRNKLEFTFSNRRWLSRQDIDSGKDIPDMEALGFHIPGFYDKVLDIRKCWLQPDPSNEIRLAVKQFAVEKGLSFFDLRANEGLLRNLIIRNSAGGEVMVVMVFGMDDHGQIEAVMSFIHHRFPDLHSLAYMVNSKQNSSISDLSPVIYAGQEAIEEKMEDLRFKVGPKSFFQTNSDQAYRLYDVTREFAGLSGREVLYDLYTGTGTIACFLASKAGKVVGIEYVDEAVAHARDNALLNQIGNTTFLAGDMANVFNEEVMARHGSPDVIVTDPPRAGMHPRVIDKIILSGADRIVYVSCNPATQARDTALLSEHYRVVKSRAVDMFPHTHHIENVLLLQKKR